MYTVYSHVNKINKKTYVGITSQKPLHRWQGGRHYKGHKAFYEDILKYGWDNFEHNILYKGLTEEEAREKEVELILALDLTNKDKGYNRFKGGQIPKLSEEAREKLRKMTNFKGKKHTDEAKQKMSKNRPKKAVICVQTGEEFVSTREAERQTGVYHGDISKCCKGTLKKAGGFNWIYKG